MYTTLHFDDLPVSADLTPGITEKKKHGRRDESLATPKTSRHKIITLFGTLNKPCFFFLFTKMAISGVSWANFTLLSEYSTKICFPPHKKRQNNATLKYTLVPKSYSPKLSDLIPFSSFLCHPYCTHVQWMTYREGAILSLTRSLTRSLRFYSMCNRWLCSAGSF